MFFLVVWGVYTGRTRLRHAYAVGFTKVLAYAVCRLCAAPTRRLRGSFWGGPFFPNSPNSNSFGVFSHSKGFGAELLSDSLWFSGADPSWAGP